MQHIFKETQRFKQIWLWLLMSGLCITFIGRDAGFIYDWILSGRWSEPGNNWIGISIKILSIIVVVCMLCLLFFSRLRTIIDSSNVRVILSPLQRKEKVISWDEIDEAFIRKYRPMDDYGGWGIKHGRKGKAYNIGGTIGLQLFLKTGEKLLIGTQRPDELEKFLKENIFNGDWNQFD